MKILIAEDDPISSKILAATLRGFGHEVTSTETGAEAWKAFEEEPVRIVVSDWMMPGMDGLALCQRIRERPMTEYTYFILLTAINTSSDGYARAMAAGVDDFLPKPMNRDVLLARIHVAERILRYTTQIAQLKELLPICVYCHKISNDDAYWERLEIYLTEHTGTRFSHGVCPDCLEEQLAKLNEEGAN